MQAQSVRLSIPRKPDTGLSGRVNVRDGDKHAIPDEALARRLQAGDVSALSILVKRYSDLVKSIAYRMLHDRAEAEDVTQTVFWDTYRAIGRYDAKKGTLRIWLLQYAYHRTLNHKKSLQQRGFYQSSAVEAIDEHVPLRRSLLSAEAVLAVRQGLSLLTEDQRITLQMVFLEGMEMEDVANRLGQNASNVRHHYYRGLKRLREVLGPKAFSSDKSTK